MSRRTTEDLKEILKRRGYGIQEAIGGNGIGYKLAKEKLLIQAGNQGKVSDVEQGTGYPPLRPKDLAFPHTGRCIVRLKVFRQRLTDTGNDCWKYHLDACRYLGLLADDNDASIRLEEEPHEKVKTKDEERVEITIEYPGIDLSDVCKYYESGPKNL